MRGDSKVVGNRKLLRDNGIDPSLAKETIGCLENEGKTALLAAFVHYYNTQRPNQALDNRTPAEEMMKQ